MIYLRNLKNMNNVIINYIINVFIYNITIYKLFKNYIHNIFMKHSRSLC